MKTVIHNKTTKETVIYSCKTDLLKLLGKNEVTLWRWSKDGIRDTGNFIIYFNCEEQKSKRKKGNVDNFAK